MHCRVFLTLFLTLVIALGFAPAQEVKDRTQQKNAPAGAKAPDGTTDAQLKDNLQVSQHSLKIGDTKLDYTATAGTLVLREEDGKALANMFFVAYTRDGVKDLSKRPVTFAFNGGPGSSSAWLHLGAFGPKKVQLDENGNPLPPPARLVDNPFNLLDVTDLVFIDPVTTGYSRPAPGVPNSKFHGVQQDLDTVGDFIQLYTTRFKRWPSPKFLAGESYGGTRAAGLANLLQGGYNMTLNGVILVSPALNFGTIRFDEGNDLPYILFFPTYAATAWYHKCLNNSLQSDLKKTVAEAKVFAETEYNVALMKGDRLTEAEKKSIAAKVAHFTGLSEKYVLQSNLRIPIQRFCRELLRDQRKTVGRLDSRFTGYGKDAAGETPDYDPASAAHSGSFAGTVNQYLRNDLKFESDLTYELLSSRVQPWDYGNAKNTYLNVDPRLRQAMTMNPELRVFVADGYYDLATPFCATDYCIDHLGLEPALLGNITTRHYEAGHMMYVHKGSHDQLHKDLTKFYQSATC
jgi:carboxypeptidase C (cathepsin A)